MKTMLPRHRSLIFALLAMFVLAGSAQAQNNENASADTLILNDKTVVITVDEEGRKVYINGKEADEVEGGRYFFKSGPGEDRFRAFVRPDGENHRLFMRNHRDEGPQVSWFGDGGEDLVFDLDGAGPLLEGLAEVNVFPEGIPFGRERDGMMRERAEIARMDMDSRRLARQVRQSSGSEREELEAQLDELLDDIYARKQAARASQIERLEKQLAELRASQQVRQSSRQDIIERRKKELLGERDELDW